MRQVSKKQAARNYRYRKTVLDLIFNRARGFCENCRQLPDWRGLSAHHKIKRRFNDDSPENLIILCGKCHSKAEGINEV